MYEELLWISWEPLLQTSNFSSLGEFQTVEMEGFREEQGSLRFGLLSSLRVKMQAQPVYREKVALAPVNHY